MKSTCFFCLPILSTKSSHQGLDLYFEGNHEICEKCQSKSVTELLEPYMDDTSLLLLFRDHRTHSNNILHVILQASRESESFDFLYSLVQRENNILWSALHDVENDLGFTAIEWLVVTTNESELASLSGFFKLMKFFINGLLDYCKVAMEFRNKLEEKMLSSWKNNSATELGEMYPKSTFGDLIKCSRNPINQIRRLTEVLRPVPLVQALGLENVSYFPWPSTIFEQFQTLLNDDKASNLIVRDLYYSSFPQLDAYRSTCNVQSIIDCGHMIAMIPYQNEGYNLMYSIGLHYWNKDLPEIMIKFPFPSDPISFEVSKLSMANYVNQVCDKLKGIGSDWRQMVGKSFMLGSQRYYCRQGDYDKIGGITGYLQFFYMNYCDLYHTQVPMLIIEKES